MTPAPRGWNGLPPELRQQRTVWALQGHRRHVLGFEGTARREETTSPQKWVMPSSAPPRSLNQNQKSNKVKQSNQGQPSQKPMNPLSPRRARGILRPERASSVCCRSSLSAFGTGRSSETQGPAEPAGPTREKGKGREREQCCFLRPAASRHLPAAGAAPAPRVTVSLGTTKGTRVSQG